MQGREPATGEGGAGTVRAGFPQAERARVAALFWDAFGPELGRLLRPEARALAFLEASLRPDRAFSVTDARGRVLGVAGLRTGQDGLLAAGFATLSRVYGLPGALWRSPLLDRLDCAVAPGQMALDGLFVARPARGRGIGTRLVGAVIDEARRRGCDELRLEVASGNARARALYERSGFVGPGERRFGLVGAVTGMRRATVMTHALG
jgi:ribosomal protein S18 acetylase RimI-like enzyme